LTKKKILFGFFFFSFTFNSAATVLGYLLWQIFIKVEVSISNTRLYQLP